MQLLFQSRFGFHYSRDTNGNKRTPRSKSTASETFVFSRTTSFYFHKKKFLLRSPSRWNELCSITFINHQFSFKRENQYKYLKELKNAWEYPVIVNQFSRAEYASPIHSDSTSTFLSHDISRILEAQVSLISQYTKCSVQCDIAFFKDEISSDNIEHRSDESESSLSQIDDTHVTQDVSSDEISGTSSTKLASVRENNEEELTLAASKKSMISGGSEEEMFHNKSALNSKTRLSNDVSSKANPKQKTESLLEEKNNCNSCIFSATIIINEENKTWSYPSLYFNSSTDLRSSQSLQNSDISSAYTSSALYPPPPSILSHIPSKDSTQAANTPKQHPNHGYRWDVSQSWLTEYPRESFTRSPIELSPEKDVAFVSILHKGKEIAVCRFEKSEQSAHQYTAVSDKDSKNFSRKESSFLTEDSDTVHSVENWRIWTLRDLKFLQNVIETWMVSLLLDQRGKWNEKLDEDQKLVLHQMRTMTTNLLSQLRSPVVALMTFGKLLLRRLPMGDVSRDLAQDIMIQSERLQEVIVPLSSTVNTRDNSYRDDKAYETDTELMPYGLNENWDPDSSSQNDNIWSEEISLFESDNESLDWNTIEANAENRLLDLSLVIDPIVKAAQMICVERCLLFKHKVDYKNVYVNAAHEEPLQKILGHLLDNSLKYTEYSDIVELIVKKNDDNSLILIRVSDTGYGIPSDEIDLIFQKGFRGESAVAKNVPGAGMGLFHVKELVHALGGAIKVQSPNHLSPNQARLGTSFFIEIPIT